SFFVPAFLVKRDLVPLPEAKKPNELEFTVTEKGTYAGQCAEFCGDLHAHMTFSVQAMSRADFDKWFEAIRSGESPPPPSVGADAPVLKLGGANIALDTKDLDVAAGQPFKIEFTNDDAVEHNVGIYGKDDKELFKGEAVTGPGKTVTYLVNALEAGEYTFVCDFHPGPAMTGTLTVK